MKPTILGLRTTIYKVPDIAAATKWYNKAFRTKPYFEEVFYVGYNIGGYELGLHPYEGKKVTVGDNIFSYWGVKDIEAEFKHFIELGATAYEEIEDVGGEILTASVKDPWGNLIGLIYNPSFKAQD